MRTPRHHGAFLLAGLLACSSSALAQSAEPDTTACEPGDCSGPAPAVTTDVKGDTPTSQPEIYAASLNGRGPIALTGVPGEILFGIGLSSGWDTNPDNGTRSVATRLYVANPYAGFRITTPRTQTLVQYSLTAANYNSSYAGQVLHAGSARILRSVTDRWTVDFSGDASYGTNGARLLGSQQSLIAGSVQGTGSEAASYLGDEGNVTNVSADLGTSFQVSARDSLQLRISDGFTRFSGHSQENSILTSTFSFGRELSAIVGISGYAQASHYYGTLSCDSFGIGVALQWKWSDATSLSASGGPQVNASNCHAQQGAAYNVAITRKFGDRSEAYLVSKREPGTSYLGPGLWQDTTSLGIARQVSRGGVFQVNLAYLHSVGLDGGQAYNPVYLDTEYGYKISHSLRSSLSYRAYKDLSGGTNASRNVAMITVSWSPDHTTSGSR